MKGSQQGGVGCSMGPPFLFIEGGGSQQGKVGFTPLYPAVNPTPHCCQCRTDVKLKFLVGNNLQPPGPLSLLILPTSNGNGVPPLPPPTHRKRGNPPLIRGGPSSTVGRLLFPHS